MHSDRCPSLLNLPDELQIKILSNLSLTELMKVTMVCQKWKILAFDGSLWTSINITPFYKFIPIETILKIIKSSSRFLQQANFRGCIQLTGHELRMLSEHCPNIEVLIIKDCRRLSTASISYSLKRTIHLRELDISGLDIVKDSTLAAISSSLSNLEKLNMSWCRNITGNGIVPLIKASSSTLYYLKLNGCSQMDEETMESIAKYAPNLKHLSMVACISLTDQSLFSFFKHHSSHLIHLNLSNCSRLTDISLRNMALYLNKLSHLELAGCVSMTDQGFSYLSPRLQTLEYLDLEDLQHITETTVRSIANTQSQLRRLCLSNCTQINNEAITYLVLNGCHQLNHLELDNCNITDEVLDTIASHLQQQSRPNPNRHMKVEVLDCSHITASGVRAALSKSSSLTIKSFYSFQEEENRSIELNGEEDTDIAHRQSISDRYDTMTRRRRNTSSHADYNCIIL